ncbi:MAG: hypothetical protein DKINENOH_02321 [bacterium]|nr:hypothetical protein [bacterium]
MFFKKSACLIVAVVLIPLVLSAQTQWQTYPGNPLITANVFYSMDPAVVFNPATGLYQMWYTADQEGHYYVFYATSEDGLAWEKFGGNPVLSPGPESAWDGWHARCSAVVFDGEKYHMFYMGASYSSRERIGLATSFDGIHWQKYQNNPILGPGAPGTWDQTQVYHPEVYFDGAMFYLWYAGYNGSTMRGGLATSPDGMHWTKHPANPVLQVGAPGEWDDYGVWPNSGVVRSDGVFYLLYSAASNQNTSRGAIGLATSADGVHWTKHQGNPVLRAGAPGSWNQAGLGPGALLFDGTYFKLWFAGHTNPTNTWHIGYAQSARGAATDFALEFDGRDDIVKIPDAGNALDLDDFTIEAWVYRLSANANHMLVSKAEAGETAAVNSNFWLWIKDNNRAEVGWELANSENQQVESTTAIAPNKWYHIAGVRAAGASTLRIYVNGELDAPPHPTSGQPNRQDVPVYLGDTPGVANEKFHGIIDEVRIWNVARSAAEIRATMNAELTGSEPGLVGYWRLNEGEGQLVHDQSPSGNHGQRGLLPEAESADPRWVGVARTGGDCAGIPLPAAEAYGNINGQDQSHADHVVYCFPGQPDDLYLSFAAYDIDTPAEIVLRLNGMKVFDVPVTPNNGWSGLFGVLLPDDLINDLGSNELVFDNVKNPPKNWRWGVRQVSVDRFQALPSFAALGNIKGGDQSHADKVVYFFSGQPGDLRLAYEVYDIDHPNELDLLLNGVKLHDEAVTSNESWSGPRTLLLPDEFANDAGINVLIFENTQNPPRQWLWGVRNVSIEPVTTQSLALALPANIKFAGEQVQWPSLLFDGRVQPPARPLGDDAELPDSTFAGATTVAVGGRLTVDLTAAQPIDALVLHPDPNAQRYFHLELEASLDGQSWQPMMTSSGVALQGTQFVSLPRLWARFLRLRGASMLVATDSLEVAGAEAEFWRQQDELIEQAPRAALAVAELVLLSQQGAVEVNDPAAVLPAAYRLAQNFPNPFNPTTTIQFDLPRPGRVQLAIYDVNGTCVRLLQEGNLPAGAHAVTFEPRGLASGIYFYRLEAGGFRATRKLLLLR